MHKARVLNDWSAVTVTVGHWAGEGDNVTVFEDMLSIDRAGLIEPGRDIATCAQNEKDLGNWKSYELYQVAYGRTRIQLNLSVAPLGAGVMNKSVK